MDRVDVLGKRPERGRLFRGRVLAEEADDVLEALVREAATSTGAPIALVSLVLDKIQLFRAQVGLPPDLALARATDRDVSFCQFVVADRAPLAVEDAPAHGRVPQDLVERYGIRSYYGVPIHVDGDVVGSLCVIDDHARDFSEVERERMQALAREVDARLEALAGPAPLHAIDVTATAARPAFGELRNRLQSIFMEVSLARFDLVEVAPLHRLASGWAQDGVPPALEVLSSSVAALTDLDATLARVESEAEAMSAGIAALEDLFAPDDGPRALGTLLPTVAQLSLHSAKLVGGLQLPDEAMASRVDVHGGAAVSTMAAAVVALVRTLNSRGHHTGISISVEPGETAHTIVFEGPTLDDDARAVTQLAIAKLGDVHPGISVALTPKGVAVSLPAAT